MSMIREEFCKKVANEVLERNGSLEHKGSSTSNL